MPAYGPVFGCLTYLILFIHGSKGGPITSKRPTREIYPEIEPENDVNQSQVCIVGDVIYGIDEAVPAEQPCLKCKCQPPGIQCEAMRCGNKKPGCKAVHRPNQCCPAYQCECEYNGKKYSNGERLETSPGNECKVCYCRGGEIQCADVSCYMRNDCEGKQVMGQCCPKYDHCPTRDSPENINNVSGNSTSVISEIVIAMPTTPTETFINDELDNLPNQEGNAIQSEVTSIQQGNFVQNPKITIQEIIPEVREIPITPSPNPGQTPETLGSLIIEETKTTQEHQEGEERPNDLFVTDSDAESSEITEVIQNPPPVIRIGDTLLFLKRNELINEKDASSTPASIITLVGAEGLQRGGFEEIVENITNSEDSMQSTREPYSTRNIEENTNDLTSASSSHILSLVKKKRRPTGLMQSTTTSPTSTSSISSISDSTTSISSSIEQNISTTDTAPSFLPSTVSDTINPTMLSQNSSEAKESSSSSMCTSTESTIEFEKMSRKENGLSEVELDKIMDTLGYTAKVENITYSTTDGSSAVTPKLSGVNVVPLINLKAALPSDILNSPNEGYSGNEDLLDDGTLNTTFIETTTDAGEDLNITEATLNIAVEILNITKNLDSTEFINRELESTESLRSVEVTDNSKEYSGEKTTPKYKTAMPMRSEENASVENGKSETEADDMLIVKEYTIDLSKDEEKTDSDEKKISMKSENDLKVKDVEMINVEELKKNKAEPREKLPAPEKLATRNIHKRENSAESGDDAVFAQLNQELGLGPTEKPKTHAEEELESRKIFQELLEETFSPKSIKPLQGRTKETEALEKVSQALAKLALGNSHSLDIGVIGALRDFFSSQYKAYDSRTP